MKSSAIRTLQIFVHVFTLNGVDSYAILDKALAFMDKSLPGFQAEVITHHNRSRQEFRGVS